ncbi:MAG: ABC transporter ATP-binding protein [Candidatus Sumerlaeaceae bacterium]
MAERSPAVINVQDLVVEYKTGRQRVRAVDGITFQVQPGECVGFIGANGAGKSSTIKTMMGFMFPARGSVQIFGSPAGTVESRRRLGYLPEVALYYPFMKARELLELYGGLHGLSRADLKVRIPALLEEVGLKDKGELLLKNISKGMQQRVGIAQAIIADPEAMIFDELSSGLDPVGRFDLREVLLKLKARGRTIFFSSHELSEVESLCDRVIMIHQGRIISQATVPELMKPLNEFEIAYRLPAGVAQPAGLSKFSPEPDGDQHRLRLKNVQDYAQAIAALASSGATVLNTSSRTQSLEDYFISLVRLQTRSSAGVDGALPH